MVKGFNCVCFLICAKHANRIIGPRCLAACDATLWDQKAKSQKSTATCQSHSSEFGLWTWNGVRGLIISSLTANGRWRIPTTPAFSSFKKPKKKIIIIYEKIVRERKKVWDSCFLVQSYSSLFYIFIKLHSQIYSLCFLFYFFSSVCSNFLASSCFLQCFFN
jgi:hypothetical protein